MSFKETIRQLRDVAGDSQQEVADAIGLARATYASLEVGRRDPSLTEITNLAKHYGVEPASLISEQANVVYEPVAPYKFEDREEITPRELDPQADPEKLREVLLYVLKKVGAKPNVGETVLYKLLYFIDFDYYEKTGQSITGLTYLRNHFGPTPSITFKEVVEGMRTSHELDVVETRYFKNIQKKYLPTVDTDLSALSGRELKHIDATLARLSDKSASELSELSHYDTPWVVAKQGEPIAYRDVFYRTIRTAVTEPDDEL